MLMSVAACRENHWKDARRDRRIPIPRRGELQSGGYLDYSDHCTVIGVIRYPPIMSFSRRAVSENFTAGLLECGVLVV